MTTAPSTDTADAAFLATILANPLDDAPRLVYADWLDETGRGEYGEFVRTQIELARSWVPHRDPHIAGPGGKQPADPERYDALRRRERELWESRTADGGWLILPDRPINEAHYCIPTDSMAGATNPNVLPIVVVRRGFIDSVSLPTAALVGGPCERCEGRGRVPFITGSFRCMDCKGNRTVGGIAARLARCPLTGVRLSDREPYENVNTWEWYSDARRTAGQVHPASDIPDAIWRKLSGAVELFPLEMQAGYPTPDAAVAALSAACLEYVRQVGQKATARPKSLL